MGKIKNPMYYMKKFDKMSLFTGDLLAGDLEGPDYFP